MTPLPFSLFVARTRVGLLMLGVGLVAGCGGVSAGTMAAPTGAAAPQASVIVWAPPGAIAAGTALSARELNATANTPGTFAYTPASGTVLGVGAQVLAVAFTPADGAHYASASQTRTVTVAAPAPVPVKYGFSNVKIGGGGYVTGLVGHPTAKDVRYARTDVGGCYRWDGAAGAWVSLLDFTGRADWFPMGCEAIALDPADPQRLYLAVGMYAESFGTKGQMLLSADSGRTFTTVVLPFKNGSNDAGRNAGERLAVDPNLPTTLYFGTRNDGLWRSVDRGLTWAKVGSFPVTGATAGAGINFVDFARSSGGSGSATPVIYVGVSDTGVSATGYAALYRSTDAGATWSVVLGQPVGMYASHGVMGPDGALYLAMNNAVGPAGITAGALWRYGLPGSPDGAGTWTNITPGFGVRPAGSQGGFGTIAAALDRPGVLMATTIDDYYPGDDVFRSQDYGAHWVSLNAQGKVHDASASPWVKMGAATAGTGNWAGALLIDPLDANHALYGTGQTIWESGNLDASDAGRGATFRVATTGLEETVVLTLVSPPAGPPLVSGVSDLGGFVHGSLTVSPAGGAFATTALGSGTGLDFAEALPAMMVRVGSGLKGHYGAYTLDGGGTWTGFAANPAGTATGEGAVAVSADGGTFVWAPADGPVAYSRDKGATWVPSAGAAAYSGVVADRVNAKKFYVLNGATLESSTDGGATFHDAAHGLPNGGRLAASFAGEGDLWLTAYDGLYHSTDSGATFARVGGLTESYLVGFGKAAVGAGSPTIFAGGTVGGISGVYRSTDGGATWTRVNDDAHQWGVIQAMVGDPRTFGRVYLGTGGRGIVVGDAQ